MKKLMVAVALVASVAMADECFCGGKKCADGVNCEYVLPYGAKAQTLLHTCQGFKTANELLEAFDEAVKVDAEREMRTAMLAALVKEVYGEGTNSSFVTRKELTATQRRFIEMGMRLVALSRHVEELERRVRSLEESGKPPAGRFSIMLTEEK